MHLLSSEEAIVAGYDGFRVPPNRWFVGDLVVQKHHLALPGDPAPRAYPIELGWHEREKGAWWAVDLSSGIQVDRRLLWSLKVRTREERRKAAKGQQTWLAGPSCYSGLLGPLKLSRYSFSTLALWRP
jgi:hypothetical protein